MTQRMQTLRPSLAYRLAGAILVAGCSNGVVEVGAGDAQKSGQANIDLFSQAKSVQLNSNGFTTISGELADSGGIAAYDLGSVGAGSRVMVDVAGYGSNFSLGLFDQDLQVRMVNHDRSGGRDPYAVLELLADIHTLYLVVCSDPIQASAGHFAVTIVHTDHLSFQATGSQNVVLNFSGGQSVAIGNVFIARMSAFNAADLDASWTGLTQEIKNIVMENLVRAYRGLDVEFYFDDDPHRPAGDFTTLHFGTEDSRNVGLAASIDYGNRSKTQSAIVYTQNFAKYIPYGYTHVEIARGFANVAAHELGHLLGLNHTDLPADVMNVSPTVDALVAPKYFVEEAALDPSAFPIGLQDGAEGIFETVGGDWPAVLAARDASAAVYAEVLPEEVFNGARTARADLAQLSSSERCRSNSKPGAAGAKLTQSAK